MLVFGLHMNNDLSDVLTAVVLTGRDDLCMDLKGLKTIMYVNKFDPTHDLVAQLHHYRKRSVHLPQTPYMCWVDDDDELPDNIQDVCKKLIQKMRHEGTYIGYTDELVNTQGIGKTVTTNRARKKPYSRQEYEKNPYQVMHHLVIMQTNMAQYVDALIPEGIYITEFLFNLYLAELGVGATYLPEIGYIWNQSNKTSSMHLQAAASPARQLCNRYAQEYLPRRRQLQPN